MQFWIVAQYIEGEPPRVVWDFQGVFDSEDRAVAACRNERYSICPVTLNEELPDELVPADWRYPIAEERADGTAIP